MGIFNKNQDVLWEMKATLSLKCGSTSLFPRSKHPEMLQIEYLGAPKNTTRFWRCKAERFDFERNLRELED
jgi:hypothetical protein